MNGFVAVCLGIVALAAFTLVGRLAAGSPELSSSERAAHQRSVAAQANVMGLVFWIVLALGILVFGPVILGFMSIGSILSLAQ